jgi:hypothetical protein
MKTRTALLGLAAVLSLGVLATYSALFGRSGHPYLDAAWVSEKVQAWKLAPSEAYYREIGWAPNLADALWLARTYSRPVALFVSNGEICSGRL